MLRKFALIAVLVIHSTLFAATPFEAAQAALNQLPVESRPIEMRAARNGAIYALLPNGCEIIVLEKHTAPVAAVQAWVRTGAIHEGKWMGAGLSHFCEHMLFKGTTKRPTGVLDQEIRGAGGDDNAYTNSERTVYHITTQADGFNTSFAAIADMLMDSTFPPEETTKEHGVVVKEIERYQDSADSVLWESFERTIYQEHPYRVPVLGYADRFKRVTRNEVFAYYKERYSPQLSTFIAVGDFKAEAVMPEMAKTLAAWKRTSISPIPIPTEPEQVAPRKLRLTHPLCEVPKAMFGFPTVSMRHPDLYALDILASIMGDGRSSSLYRRVIHEKKLALEISAWSNTPLYNGYFAVMFSAEADKLCAAKKEALQVIEEAKTKPPTEEELARAKKKVMTRNVFAKMTAEGVAGSIGSDWFIAGDLDFSEHYTERMQKVTADDVVRVAKKYLVTEKLNTAVMLPEVKGAPQPPNLIALDCEEATITVGELVKYAETSARLNEELTKQLEEIKKDPSVASASIYEEKNIFEIALKSGLKLVVREDRSLPVVNVAVASLGGTRWEPAELAGAGNLLAEMLDRGTASRTKIQIAEETELLGTSVETFSGRNSFGVTVSGLKQDLPKLMDLAADSLLRPTFPKEELDQLKDETIQQIIAQDESLFSIAGKQLRPLLYGNHPYARTNLGTQETVAKVTPEDLKKLHAAWVLPLNMSVCIVGDITPADALKLVTQQFGALKSVPFTPPPIAPIPALTEGKTANAEKPGIKGAILMLGFQGANLKSEDRETLDLIAALLSGLGGRLSVSIREQLGIAYVVGVGNDSQLDGGNVTFYIQTDGPNLDKALDAMWKEAKKLRDEPVTEKELASVKNYLVGTEAIELQDQSGLAQRLALSQLYGEGAANVFARKTRLEKVTPETIKAAATKYFDLNKWGKAVLKAKE